MTIVLECENGHKLRVKDSLAGKKVRCPKCQVVVLIEAPGSDAGDSESFDDFNEPSPAATKMSRAPQRSTRAKSAKPKQGNTGANPVVMICAGLLGLAVVGGGGYFAVRTLHTSTSNDSAAARPPADVAAKTDPPKAHEASTAKADAPKAAPATASQAHAKSVKPAAPVATVVAAKTVATTSAARPISAKPAPLAKTAVTVWDTNLAGQATDGWHAPVGGSQEWTQLSAVAAPSHHFQGDCVVENEHLRLWLPATEGAQPIITAVSKDGTGATVPVYILSGKGLSGGPRSNRISQISADSADIVWGAASGAQGAQIACRLSAGKHCVEFKALGGADKLAMGTKSQYIVVPREFGEDWLCDSMYPGLPQSVTLPRENLVLALQCEGNFLSALIYPSFKQSGELFIASGQNVQNHDHAVTTVVSAVTAKFDGKSVFVGVLPQPDLWYSEAVTRKYSASGEYPIKWKPPYPGVWRLIGRIAVHDDVDKIKGWINDVPHDHLVFGAANSGTLDCLFAYLNGAPEGVKETVVSPMTVYREALGSSKEQAYFLETEHTAPIYLQFRNTRYRDMCSAIDDMKDRWRNKPDTVRKDPDYITTLLEDSRYVIERLDRRLTEYRELIAHVATVVEKLKKNEKPSPELKAFTTAVQNGQVKLKSVKITQYERAENFMDKIQTKLKTNKGNKYPASELDQIAENARAVANHMEEELKKLRAGTVALGAACLKYRSAESTEVRAHAVEIGQHCRKVIRNRDTEE